VRGTAELWRAIRPWLQGIGELVFEPVCHGCLANLPDSENAPAEGLQSRAWCANCLEEMLSNLSSCCARCGAASKFVRPQDADCRLCRQHRFRFDRSVAVGNYQARLSELVVRMKGLRDESLAWQMGLLLGQRVKQVWGADRFDLLVPVPCWWGKRLRKGFVAAEIIANAVSHVTKIPESDSALRCCRKTSKQGTLSTSARFRNVIGMFELAVADRVRGKRVLLVDDVMTSGATASQAAGVLRRFGCAESVDLAVLARGTRGK